MKTYYGKYRGKVTANVDTENRGRIQVSVPLVFGQGRLSWAMPCVPYSGIQAGIFAVPSVNANVWVEFEGGNPEFPIWSGCFWGTGETPSLASTPPLPVQHILLQTPNQNLLHLCDAPGPAGGIVLRTSGGASILINDTGIQISNGKGATIAMTQNTVMINGQALVVT